MIRTPAILFLAVAGLSAAQEKPETKTQILLNTVLFTTAENLWADVRKVDADFNEIEGRVAKLVVTLESGSVDERSKAIEALKSLGLAAFGAIREERDRTVSEPARRDLALILKDLAGDWPGAVAGEPAGKSLGSAEAEALRIEVAKLAQKLEADAIEERSRAAGALKALGVDAYATIKAARNRTPSEQARRELDAVLKELAGPAVIVPMGRSLSRTDGLALKAKLGERRLRVLQQPFISLKDGSPASVFVGEEIPAGPGRRRLRLDPEGKRLRLEETPGAGTLKVGFLMLIKPRIVGEKRETVALDIAITDSHVRRPIREIDTPLGKVTDPEVVQVGIDLSPVLESGGHYLAGPLPSADEKSPTRWILIEAQIMGK